VICSHVIEHVADPAFFLDEVSEWDRSWLSEYPLITYEYLYDFDVHRHFVKFDFTNRVLKYLPKEDTALSEFAPVCEMLRMTLESGWEICVPHTESVF